MSGQSLFKASKINQMTFEMLMFWSGLVGASTHWQTGNGTPVWYMAVGQSLLSCWIQVAKAQELLWPGCQALAAENYSFGQESQPNGLILLIQPKGLHTAALSFTAREEDGLKEGEEKERRSGEQLGAFGLDRPQRPGGLFSCKKETAQSHLGHQALFKVVFGLWAITLNPLELFSFGDWDTFAKITIKEAR